MGFQKKQYRVATLQLVGWGVILITTLLWSISVDAKAYERFGAIVFVISILPLLAIYLINFYYIIPKFLFNHRRGGFMLTNTILVVSLLLFSYVLHTEVIREYIMPEYNPRRSERSLMFLVRDCILYILMIGLVTAVRLVGRLQQSEEALREAESARVRAELDNLKSQVNPHFLLNTLNNIYSLTAIDTERAQKTIIELSRLLRYVLYENHSDRVKLSGEVNFLKDYIELMRIRLSSRVKLDVEFNVEPNSSTQIAPLIFISLIENAFKHGVSADRDSFISIKFEDKTQSGEVVVSIVNSNNAKTEDDRSGHGVGLEQVRRRLELQYANGYEWEIINSSEMYSSILKLKV